MSKWTGLCAESSEEDFIEGDELYEGDTIYLFGVEGHVIKTCGAWGWGSSDYVPWEELEKRIPHKNNPNFCYCDNFISFWELKWNFDDGSEWDGVPFIKKEAKIVERGKCATCGKPLSEGLFLCSECKAKEEEKKGGDDE